MDKSFSEIVSPGDVLSVDAVLELISRSLYQINTNLTLHCERTAFMAVELLRGAGYTDRTLLQNIYLLSLLHTIGFYRHDSNNIGKPMPTPEEIYENQTLAADAFWFSQCYIKHMTPLGNLCNNLRFYNLPYNENLKNKVKDYEITDLFFLASRIIAWTFSADFLPETDFTNKAVVSQITGSYISEKAVDVFLSVNKDNYLMNTIDNGNFILRNKFFQQVISYTEEEKFQLVKLLIYIMDLKSTFTLNHIIKTSCYALSIGLRMNLPEKDLNILFMGALLHDIGKLKTPAMILESAGRLENNDMIIMRAHVNHTKRILQGIIPKNILDNACHHHEKLNGTGYPLGLMAGNLSVIDRILTVSDVASALSEKRSYKSEFTREKVIEILTDLGNKGELDENAIQVFCGSYDEIRTEVLDIQQIMSTNFSMVLAEYYSQITDAEEAGLETAEDLDDIEDLEEVEELEEL